MGKSQYAALAVLAVCTSPVLAQSVPADWILHGGKVVTLDKRSSIAQAVAIRDGKFLAVGSDDVKRFSGPSIKVIDLNGRTVVPPQRFARTSRASRFTRSTCAT
jgi:adenine deaminase